MKTQMTPEEHLRAAMNFVKAHAEINRRVQVMRLGMFIAPKESLLEMQKGLDQSFHDFIASTDTFRESLMQLITRSVDKIDAINKEDEQPTGPKTYAS